MSQIEIVRRLTGEGDVVVLDALLGEAVEGAVAEPPLVLPSPAEDGEEDNRDGPPKTALVTKFHVLFEMDEEDYFDAPESNL